MADRLKMGMVGGGVGSFIGPMHRLGAYLSDRIELVAGAFSSDADRGLAAAATHGVAPERSYSSYQAMFAGEAKREDGIDLVVIATPNHLHLPVALEAIAAGVHILSDKPATATLDEALVLRDALAESDRIYALTFSYTGYPMVREARARVASGALGAIRKVVVTYSQGWLSTALEQAGNARAGWRTDPARSGVGGCSADIGVHAFNLAEFVTGDAITQVNADLRSLVPGRALDDDCNVLLRFAGGAAGVLVSSQVAFGERNGLSIQVYGETGALHWAVEQADQLRLTRPDGGVELLSPMSPGLLTREPLPPGLGNGMIVPFAILYRDFANAVAGTQGLVDGVLPGIEAGVRSMRFVQVAVESSARGGGWAALA